MKMPAGLEYMTADTVAETVPYADVNNHLYNKLWGFLKDAKNPTPLGGDGSNGTVETPDGRLDLANDDKAGHWWHKLTESEQKNIAQAWEST